MAGPINDIVSAIEEAGRREDQAGAAAQIRAFTERMSRFSEIVAQPYRGDSEDGMASVEVNASGALLKVELSPRLLDRSGADALQRAVITAQVAARDAMNEGVRAVYRDEFGIEMPPPDHDYDKLYGDTKAAVAEAVAKIPIEHADMREQLEETVRRAEAFAVQIFVGASAEGQAEVRVDAGGLLQAVTLDVVAKRDADNLTVAEWIVAAAAAANRALFEARAGVNAMAVEEPPPGGPRFFDGGAVSQFNDIAEGRPST